jgi:uncharacterized protein (TIGR02996 family)
MSDRDALFQAILAAPGDDAPRLVYADWLDENGDADRAEFIRVQCRMARLPFYEPEYATLERRSAEILSVHQAGWRLRLPAEQVFRRGFVEELTLSAGLFANRAEQVFGQAPVRWVRFGSPPAETWRRWDLLARLEGIAFPGAPWGQRDDWLGLDLPRVTWLKAVGVPDVTAFLGTCPTLNALDVSDSRPTEAELAALLTACSRGRLRALALDGSDDAPYATRLRAGGARVVADGGLTSLTRLHLRRQVIGDAGLFHLARSPAMSRLEELYLSGNEIGQIGTTGIEELCSSPYLTRLRALDLSGNPLGLGGVRELAGWPGLKDLRWLDVSACGLTAEAARTLAGSPFLHDRLRLRVHDNPAAAGVFPPSGSVS